MDFEKSRHHPVSEKQSWDWRISCKSNYNKIVHVYDNEMYCDVDFFVGKKKERISSHKFILLLNSFIFEEMFSNAPGISEFVVEDLSPETFRQLLRFIFTGECDTTMKCAIELVKAAKKYKVHGLIKLCDDTIREGLTRENALEIFKYAKVENDDSLIKACRLCIQENAEKIVDSEQFTSIDFETLCEFLKDDHFFVEEVKLFSATVRWATEACIRNDVQVTPSNLRHQLGTAVHLIRYPLMSVLQFNDTVDSTDILTVSERRDLYRFFATLNKDEGDLKAWAISDRRKRKRKPKIINTVSFLLPSSRITVTIPADEQGNNVMIEKDQLLLILRSIFCRLH